MSEFTDLQAALDFRLSDAGRWKLGVVGSTLVLF